VRSAEQGDLLRVAPGLNKPHPVHTERLEYRYEVRHYWFWPDRYSACTYRRGLATNLKELGVEDTTIQCILRHENVTTTQRFYIKTSPRVAHEAMQKLSAKITGTPLVHQAMKQ